MASTSPSMCMGRSPSDDHPLPQAVAASKTTSSNTASAAVDIVATSCCTANTTDQAAVHGRHSSSQRVFNQPQLATSAAAAATACSARCWEGELQDMAGAVIITRKQGHSCLTASTDLVRYTSTDSISLRIEELNEVRRPQLKRRLSCIPRLDLPADDEEQQGDPAHQQSNMTARKQSRSPIVHIDITSKTDGDAAAEEDDEDEEAMEEEEKEEEDQEEEEEEGCRTPTAREQRIPSEVLVCPPPPKKRKMKPSEYFKRRRPNVYLHRHFISDDVAATAPATYHQIHVAETGRQAFLVNPPDLQNLPECIRALFDN